MIIQCSDKKTMMVIVPMCCLSFLAAAFIEAQVSSLDVLLWEGLHGDAEVRAADTYNSSIVSYSC